IWGLEANRAELNNVLNAVQDQLVYAPHDCGALRDGSAEQRKVWDYLCLFAVGQSGKPAMRDAIAGFEWHSPSAQKTEIRGIDDAVVSGSVGCSCYFSADIVGMQASKKKHMYSHVKALELRHSLFL